MKTIDLPVNECLVVSVVAKSVMDDGDVVIAGVPCVIKSGKLIPISKRFSMIPDIFDDPKTDGLIILKRKENDTTV